MARISTYIIDQPVDADDKWIGTAFGLGTTKNFTARGVASFLNTSSSISGQTNFFFQTNLNPGRLKGSISFLNGGGVNTPFSSLISIKVSKYSYSDNLIAEYLQTMVGLNILISQTDDINSFGVYKLNSLTQDPVELDFLDASLELVISNGALLFDKFYTFMPYASGVTDLSYTPGILDGIVNSSSGTDAVIPLAGLINAGLFSAVEKSKLGGIQPGAQVNVNADWNATSGDAQILNKPIISGINTGDNATNTTSNAYADARVSDTAYNATSWNGVTTVAPSKNAIRDKIESTGLQEITNINAQTTIPIRIIADTLGESLSVYNNNLTPGTYTSAVYGISYKIGVFGYSFLDKAVFGYAESPTGVAISGYAEEGIAGEFNTDGTTIVNFKAGGVLKSFIDSNGYLTAQKLIKDGGFDYQFLKADGSVDNNTYLTSADLPSTLDLYATTSPDPVIAGYTALVRNITDSRYNTTAVNVPTPTITGTLASPTFCGAVISDPSILLGNPGVFNFSVIGKIRRTGGSTSSGADFFFRIYKRNLAGVEELIAESAPVIVPANGGIYVEYISIALWNNGTFLSTDRVVLKFYGVKTGGGSGATYQFLFGGTDPVRGTAAISSAIIPNLYLRDLADVEKVPAENNEILYWNDPASLWEHTPAIDLIPDASATNRGALSSANWITFNSKQPSSPNLTSLAGLTYSTSAFVKMTAAGTFTLDTSGGSGETTATMGALIGSAGDAVPNNSDFVATALTAGGLLKKITWTSVKAFLKTYFDTIYSPNVYNILIEQTTTISTDTLGLYGSTSYSQNGKNVMIDNLTTNIIFQVNTTSETNFTASYTKLSASGVNITFANGTATINSPTGLFVLSGNPGSTATLTRNGNTYYLLLNNL